MQRLEIDKRPGTYALILRAATTQTVRIGRLGDLVLQPGYYIYVGSAFGPGGLAARVGRHLRKEKRLRWHIDYLRAACEVEEVWWTCDSVRRECEWANKLRELPGTVVPMVGFGSSDCGCETHLVWVETTAKLERNEWDVKSMLEISVQEYA
ncbi:MAG: GIY-YIG nuclease family protein [Caldilineaceae bacterium]